jgi:hypothetical protein
VLDGVDRVEGDLGVGLVLVGSALRRGVFDLGQDVDRDLVTGGLVCLGGRYRRGGRAAR